MNRQDDWRIYHAERVAQVLRESRLAAEAQGELANLLDSLAARVRDLVKIKKRCDLALEIIKEASGWNSSRPFTQEEARRYHVALIMATALLQGDLDDLVERREKARLSSTAS